MLNLTIAAEVNSWQMDELEKVERGLQKESMKTKLYLLEGRVIRREKYMKQHDVNQRSLFLFQTWPQKCLDCPWSYPKTDTAKNWYSTSQKWKVMSYWQVLPVFYFYPFLLQKHLLYIITPPFFCASLKWKHWVEFPSSPTRFLNTAHWWLCFGLFHCAKPGSDFNFF